MRKVFGNSSGASAVEFGLIAPVFIFTVLAALEYSLLLYSRAAMQNSARVSVRELSLGQLTDASAPAYACSKVPSWILSTCSAQVDHSNIADPKRDIITISVQAPVSKASVVNFFTRALGEFSVTARVSMRREDVL